MSNYLFASGVTDRMRQAGKRIKRHKALKKSKIEDLPKLVRQKLVSVEEANSVLDRVERRAKSNRERGVSIRRHSREGGADPTARQDITTRLPREGTVETAYRIGRSLSKKHSGKSGPHMQHEFGSQGDDMFPDVKFDSKQVTDIDIKMGKLRPGILKRGGKGKKMMQRGHHGFHEFMAKGRRSIKEVKKLKKEGMTHTGRPRQGSGGKILPTEKVDTTITGGPGTTASPEGVRMMNPGEAAAQKARARIQAARHPEGTTLSKKRRKELKKNYKAGLITRPQGPKKPGTQTAEFALMGFDEFVSKRGKQWPKYDKTGHPSNAGSIGFSGKNSPIDMQKTRSRWKDFLPPAPGDQRSATIKRHGLSAPKPKKKNPLSAFYEFGRRKRGKVPTGKERPKKKPVAPKTRTEESADLLSRGAKQPKMTANRLGTGSGNAIDKAKRAHGGDVPQEVWDKVLQNMGIEKKEPKAPDPDNPRIASEFALTSGLSSLVSKTKTGGPSMNRVMSKKSGSRTSGAFNRASTRAQSKDITIGGSQNRAKPQNLLGRAARTATVTLPDNKPKNTTIGEKIRANLSKRRSKAESQHGERSSNSDNEMRPHMR